MNTEFTRAKYKAPKLEVQRLRDLGPSSNEPGEFSY